MTVYRRVGISDVCRLCEYIAWQENQSRETCRLDLMVDYWTKLLSHGCYEQELLATRSVAKFGDRVGGCGGCWDMLEYVGLEGEGFGGWFAKNPK